MMDILNTGERILLEKETPLMIARHLYAYRFVKDYVCNKKVLDIGCGEGYGSYYLAGFAKEVVGIDYNEAIVNYAKNKYQKENLRFYRFDINNLGTFNNRFDVICAFQVIEHLSEPEKFLLDANKILNENGILICSTPNRLDASPRSEKPLNKFHIKEYLFSEFKELLERYFGKVEISGLSRGKKLKFYRRLKKVGFFNFLPASINPVKRFYNQIDCCHFNIIKDRIETALDFIAVCRKLI